MTASKSDFKKVVPKKSNQKKTTALVKKSSSDSGLIDIESLVELKDNTRIHPQAQVEKLATFIKEKGFITPVVISSSNVVLGGNGSLAAARLAGVKKVPFVRELDMTPYQRRAYVIADNRLAELGVWDEATIDSEIQHFKEVGANLPAMGFDFFDWQSDLGNTEPTAKAHTGNKITVVCKKTDCEKIKEIINSILETGTFGEYKIEVTK